MFKKKKKYKIVKDTLPINDAFEADRFYIYKKKRVGLFKSKWEKLDKLIFYSMPEAENIVECLIKYS